MEPVASPPPKRSFRRGTLSGGRSQSGGPESTLTPGEPLPHTPERSAGLRGDL
jgi:hypothetical protein